MSRSDGEKGKGWNPARRMLKESSRRKQRSTSKKEMHRLMQGGDLEEVQFSEKYEIDNIRYYD